MRKLLLLMLLCSPIAVRANTLENLCYVYADMSLTARAMAKNGVDAKTIASVLGDMYTVPDQEESKKKSVEDTIKKLQKEAVDSVLSPKEFAEKVYFVCTMTGAQGMGGSGKRQNKGTMI